MSSHDDYSVFASRLSNAINLRNIRRSDLARDCGVSRESISQYTKGICYPKVEVFKKIYKALRVNPAWLLGDDCHWELDIVPTIGNRELYRLYSLLEDEDRTNLISYCRNVLFKKSKYYRYRLCVETWKETDMNSDFIGKIISLCSLLSKNDRENLLNYMDEVLLPSSQLENKKENTA